MQKNICFYEINVYGLDEIVTQAICLTHLSDFRGFLQQMPHAS